MLRFLVKKPTNLLFTHVESNLTHVSFLHHSISRTLGEEKPIRNQAPSLIDSSGFSTQSYSSISEIIQPKSTDNSETIRNTLKSYGFTSAHNKSTTQKLPASSDWIGHAGAGGFKSMNFVKSILEEDEQNARKKKSDVVHVLMNRKKTFVTVTDARGNKKTGASAGSLEERKGRSRLSRYAAEATAEQVGRSARKIGLNSVVMKVKGSTYFRKKRKVILSWRDGFRGEGVGGRSGITSIYDVTQLPHNGCRLPKKRRV